MMTENKSAFARRVGVTRQTVKNWIASGRVVNTPGGDIDVIASLKQLEATSGSRTKHAAERAAKRAAGELPPLLPEGSQSTIDDDIGDVGNSDAMTYQAARAKRETYAALAAKLDYETRLRDVIPRDDVDSALRAFAASVRARLDVMPDQVAPLLVAVDDLHEAHAILAEQSRAILAAVADDMARAARVVSQG